MGKDLILAEKPSVGRELAGILNCKKNNGGYFEGPGHIVTWALGHLVTLAEPEDYDGKYRTWRPEDLPIIPDKTKFTVIRKTAKQFNIVRSLVLRKDVDKIVIATDAGREGELVARLILGKIPAKKPTLRLWISSQTDGAIKEGFANLKRASAYNNLYEAALCRARADWLVGLNATRAMTLKFNAQLSAGRVQTPTLALIVEREEEIRRFKSKEFWTVKIKTRGWEFSQRDDLRIFDREKAEKIHGDLKDAKLKITDIKREKKKELAPLLYDLTQLQRDANTRYGFSAKKTSDIMQSLYERHKILTYPRTDSKHITRDVVPTLGERLKNLMGTPYADGARRVLARGISPDLRIADDKKVGDHHGIIPTEKYADLSDLDNDERRIFLMVCMRFIEALSPPHIYEQTRVFMTAGKMMFSASRNHTLEEGFKGVSAFGEEAESKSFPFKKGEDISDFETLLEGGRTKPPPRYTEASLLGAMEHPGRFIDDRELGDTADKSGGLGTPATRADIIEKLFNTFYIERRGNEIYPTSKGIQLIGLVPGEMKEPELTARWEQKLTLIERGELSPSDFIDEMTDFAKEIVKDILNAESSYKHDNKTRQKCPDCEGFLLEVNGKRGRMLVCSHRQCGYRKTVSRTSNARCPQCHKRMEIRGEDDNKTFFCSCGYREKLSDFNNRKKDRVDRKEVQRFLKNQNEGEGLNDALARQLEAWKRKK